MPNPNKNNEDLMTEVKKKLDAYEFQMDLVHFDDPALNEQHQQFTATLHELSQETDHYYTMDDEGNYPIMSEQAFTKFDNLYRQVYTSLASLQTALQQAKEKLLSKNDEMWINGYSGVVNSLPEILGRDMQHLHSVQRKGNETLPELIETARTTVYNLGQQKIDRFSGNMSSRLGVTLHEQDGDVKAFFTESMYATENSEFEQLNKETIAKNPRLAEVLEDFDLDDFLDNFMAGVLDDFVLTENGSEDLGKDWFSDPKNFTRMNEEFPDFNTYLRQALAIHGKYAQREADKLGDNNKTDIKNCAMSTVADLLDMKGLLAHASPVEITFIEDGKQKEMKGSLMLHAEGEDINRQVPGKGLMRPDAPVETEAGTLKQQLADMQVLDYICGNVDRHTGNMFYKLDETDPDHPKLIGVQGIDNDASFTLYTRPTNRMIAPDNMSVIRQKTADMVEALTPDLLKTMLRNFNLNEEQLEAVWIRTRQLQEAIQEGKNYFQDKAKDALEQGHLRILDDQEFDVISMEQIAAKSYGQNYFRQVNHITEVAINNYVMNEKVVLQEKYADSHVAFYHHEKEMNDLQKELKKADSLFRTRAEYQEVLDTVSVLKQKDDRCVVCRKKSDVEEKLTQIERGLEAARKYLQHKTENYNREMQEARTKGQRAIKQCDEKYFGQKSADAQRIRAVEKLQEKLNEWKKDGEKTLQERENLIRLVRIKPEEFVNIVRQKSGQDADKKKTRISINQIEKKSGRASLSANPKASLHKTSKQNEVKCTKTF